MSKLITLWEPNKHPREWSWVRVSDEALRLSVADNEAGVHAMRYGPNGWTLAREDGVEAEVYVPL